MNDPLYTFLVVFIWGLVFIARFVADKMMETTNTKLKFILGLTLMVLYTGFMMSFVYCTYQSMLHNANLGLEDFYEYILAEIGLINFAVILVAIYYYIFWRKKHQISDMDKMKLKDL